VKHPDHFFKYYTASTAKIVLSTQRVRWNSPLNFNDPFDCYFSFEPKFDLRQATIKERERFFDILCQNEEPPFNYINRYAAILARLRQMTKGKSRAELEALLGSAFDDLIPSLEGIIPFERELWKKRMAEYRLFCVCEIKDNLLLWSHYTNNHTGVVFQFECIAELDVPLLAARQVKYSDEAPGLATEEEWISSALGLRPLNDAQEVWLWPVTTKARPWEHEKEWRIVTTRRPYGHDGYEDMLFSPREISKVLLGCRISDTDKADILNLLTGPFSHTEAYQAKQNPRMFALDFDRIK
jgi:hypothetical protein